LVNSTSNRCFFGFVSVNEKAAAVRLASRQQQQARRQQQEGFRAAGWLV
jgi:hypothetical protein